MDTDERAAPGRSGRRAISAAVVAAGTLAALGLPAAHAATRAATPATYSVTELATPAGTQPQQIVTGPDGNLWFTDKTGYIARMTLAGVVTKYAVPTGKFSNPDGLTVGPDGNLWFVERGGQKIGRITVKGVVTEYTIPTTGAGPAPVRITTGPDGALWFTESGTDKIGRVTTAGAFTDFTIPSANTQPYGIAAGQDGRVWFTEYATGRIGALTTAGVFTEYPSVGSNAFTFGIAPGPDGSMWFGEYNAQMVGHITSGGTTTAWPVQPSTGELPQDLVTASDGNVWYTMFGSPGGGSYVGYATPSGTQTSVQLPSNNAGAYGITMGPDGNLYATETFTGKVARITMAQPGMRYVYEQDLVFTPKAVKLTAQGQSVEWGMYGPNAQSVTDASGAALFDSGALPAVSWWSTTFTAAGTYAYHSSASTKTAGSVSVPLVVHLVSGTTNQTTVTWATQLPAGTYVVDVQVKVPGASAYSLWQSGATALSAVFSGSSPLYRGSGTYAFEARVRNSATGKATGWSPVASIALS